MSDNVVKLVNTKSVGPQAVIEDLEDIVKHMKSGELNFGRCVVLMLDDSEDRYHTFRSCVGLRNHQVVALLEVCKADIINEGMK